MSLILKDVRAGYGEALVLDGISLELAQGTSLAVLGRNGVGKTTLLATIMGHTRLLGGGLSWRGQNLPALAQHKRIAAGIGWVVQERGMFNSLSVTENLLVATRPGPWNLARIHELFPRLAERGRNMGNQLSGGEQQMLAIARALLGNPDLLLLDEPMEGLAPILVQEIMRVLQLLIAQDGLTLILVEQHARLALGLTEQAIVLDRGRIIRNGPSAELRADPAMADLLLGVSE